MTSGATSAVAVLDYLGSYGYEFIARYGMSGMEQLQALAMSDPLKYEAIYRLISSGDITAAGAILWGEATDGDDDEIKLGEAVGAELTDGQVELTRAQRRNINTLNNIVENNLTDGDFSGTLADLQGNPIPKPGGGYWDHLTEMKQSYTGLQSVKSGLEGSLNNPNLTSETRNLIQENLNRSNLYINKIEDLFKPYGGIN